MILRLWWTFAGWFCYYVGRLITLGLARVFWSIRFINLQNIPITGAFILSPVHRSNVDGPLTCTFTRRRMRYIAKDSLFKYPLLAKLFTNMGAFGVERGTPDRKALHKCLEELDRGYPLVLFPEGTRKEGPVVHEVNDGAAYLALRAGVPIVPVGIGGSAAAMPKGKFFKFSRITVIVGEPIYFERSESGRAQRSAVREATERVKTRLQELFDEAEGRVTA